MARVLLLAISAIFLIRPLAYAQWQANVPVETRTLDEIYQAAQFERCDQLRVAAGGDGTRGLLLIAHALIKALQPKATGLALSKAFRKDSP